MIELVALRTYVPTTPWWFWWLVVFAFVWGIFAPELERAGSWVIGRVRRLVGGGSE